MAIGKRWLIILGMAGIVIFLGWRLPEKASGQVSASPLVRYSLKNDLSPALRDIPARQVITGEPSLSEVRPVRQPIQESSSLDGNHSDWQNWASPIQMPAPLFSFEGVNNDDNFDIFHFYLLPPDPNGDIGLHHYVQWVNLAFAVWEIDRAAQTATLVYGPAAGNTLWSGFGGLCETRNNGDPVALYDTQADRWVMSQLAYDNTLPEYHQCVAVSQTGDPTGAWYRYDFLISYEKLNDYPKIAVWPDAYYLTFNQFTATDWAGQGVVALDREKMLTGQPATMVYFDLFSLDPNLGGMLPSDLDGPTLPPPGAPAYFVQFDDDVLGYSPDQLQVWQFHVDWTEPDASSFTPVTIINLSAAGLQFDSVLCNVSTLCIEQPVPDIRLDSLSDRLMYRLAYRNFGAYASLVVNHTVDVDGRGQAGIRWYELRVVGGVPELYQAGTFAPTADHRWMGSLAMDRAGNLALGYSISSKRLNPSIRYAGRLAGDPPGMLEQGETSLIEGGGSQTSFGARWGDYSMMAVDPVDDCTFWYTQEYYPVTDIDRWHTRIGAFRFPTCTSGPQGSLTGRVTDAFTNNPVPGATVKLGEAATLTDSNGMYRLLGIPVGMYSLDTYAYGYLPGAMSDVAILEGESGVQDIHLAPLPTVNVLLGVRDGGGQGWPLYARVDIAADGYTASTYTDPISGNGSVILFQDVPYTFTVGAVSAGYNQEIRTIEPFKMSDLAPTLFFTLTTNILDCDAPGYQPETIYYEDFEAGDGGFIPSVLDPSGASSWAWGTPASGPGSAHSGKDVWATNLTGNYLAKENSALTSPSIDLSAYIGQPIVLSWWQWLDTVTFYDFASVEASVDGGATWRRMYGEVGGTISPGWQPRRIFLEPDFAVHDFRVRFRLHTTFGTRANAPGFYIDDIGIGVFDIPGSVVYQQEFETSAGGYTVSGVSSWAWGAPASGPGAALSGLKVWATNLAGDYMNNENGFLTSPVIDLSAYAGRTPMFMWFQWLDTESGYDFPAIEVSRDNGRTWQPAYGEVSGEIDPNWSLHRLVLDPSYVSSGFRVRFHFSSDIAVTAPGWYLDNISIVMLNNLPAAVCASQAGGLVVGNVLTTGGYPLPNAQIGRVDGPFVRSGNFSDPFVPSSFYILFAPAGEQMLTARWGSLTAAQPVTVSIDQVIWQEFHLPAWLSWLPCVVK